MFKINLLNRSQKIFKATLWIIHPLVEIRNHQFKSVFTYAVTFPKILRILQIIWDNPKYKQKVEIKVTQATLATLTIKYDKPAGGIVSISGTVIKVCYELGKFQYPFFKKIPSEGPCIIFINISIFLYTETTTVVSTTTTSPVVTTTTGTPSTTTEISKLDQAKLFFSLYFLID